MKQVLFLDTNVVLDLLGKHEPFYQSAAQIATLADLGEIEMITSALTYATVSYFLTKFEGSEITKEKLRKFKVVSKICDFDETIIEKGLNSKFTDIEDAFQYFSALKSNSQILVTRNGKDFKHSHIPVMSPEEYLASRKKQ